MTADQVRQMLKRKQGKKTQRAMAKEIGVSEGLLCEIYRGTREPSGRVLAFLGIKREAVYR